MVGLSSGLKVSGELTGVPLEDNCIYIAHGDYHIGVMAKGKKLFLEHSSLDCDHGHRPSVDHLFLSVAKHNVSCMAVLLTGMGKDGAQGMKKLYETGEVFTVAQSEESSVIFGMPKEAIALNCVHQVGDLEQIRKSLNCVINKRGKYGQAV
jgi:two-component system chemotaxis response regulator CheB